MTTNNELTNWIIEEIKGHLEDYKGNTIYACDLAYKLFESENADGSYTCSSWQAMEWIQEFFMELGDIIEEYENDYGESLPNPFNEPERFQLCIIIYLAENLLNQSAYLWENWDDEITIDTETIQKITKSLEDK